MFRRQASNSLKTDDEMTPRRKFLRRRPVTQRSPANRFLSLVALGLTPSKKSKWRSTHAKKTTGASSSPSSDSTTVIEEESKKKPVSYAEALIKKGKKSMSSLSPSTSSSSQSNINGVVGYGDRHESPPLPHSPPPKPFVRMVSPTPRQNLFRRQPSQNSLSEMILTPMYRIDRKENLGLDDIQNTYDFDLNHDYDFDRDDDLAAERNRYEKGKSNYFDGVEMTTEEEEFTKAFNRIKLDRRPRRWKLTSPSYNSSQTDGR